MFKMGKCKILNCSSKKGEISFFNVPHDDLQRKNWKSQIKKHQTFDDIPISYPVCALHFAESDIVRRGRKTNLVKNAVPIKFPEKSGEMIVYDFVDEQPVTPHAGTQILSIEPLISDSENTHENLNETNAVSHVVTVESTVPNPMYADKTTGTGLETPNILFEVNVENHDAVEANNIECELDLEPDGGSITIHHKEYARLLQRDIELIKTTEKLQKSESLVKMKANEIKRLQTQVLYYKKKIKSSSTNEQNDIENASNNEHDETSETDVK